MKTSEIVSFESRIDGLISKARAEADSETQSHLSRYICVLASGYIEVSLRSIFSEYTRKRSSKEVVSYVEGQLERFRNPKFEIVLQLIGAFDNSIRQKIETTDDQIKNAIDSIVNNRNNIAHGKNTGIGLVVITSYYTSAKKLIQAISDEVLK